ncbi:MAG: hypothetical protein HYU39_03270 [Thaumarchaeota archaeon]|nr:hypothetical protein [Nitrososphaerota archaeon]
MVRKGVDTFANSEPWWDKNDKLWHKVLIRVGVDTNPPDPTRNAMMYLRVIEKTSKGKDDKYSVSYDGERVYFTHEQFTRLAMLMSLSRHFWSRTYLKKQKKTKGIVLNFVKTWKEIKRNITRLDSMPG